MAALIFDLLVQPENRIFSVSPFSFFSLALLSRGFNHLCNFTLNPVQMGIKLLDLYANWKLILDAKRENKSEAVGALYNHSQYASIFKNLYSASPRLCQVCATIATATQSIGNM